MAFNEDLFNQDTEQPETNQTNNDKQSDDVLDPVKKLGILDKTLDKAFETLLSKINVQNETIANNINNINLKTFAEFYAEDRKKKNKEDTSSIKEKLKNELQGLDGSILSQLENLSIPKERLERYKQYSRLPYELYIATRMIQVYLDIY